MGAIASQITSLTIVYSAVYSGADQSKHQSSASLAFVWGIHRGPVNSPHKWPVTWKMFPFDDVIMNLGQSLAVEEVVSFLSFMYFGRSQSGLIVFSTKWLKTDHFISHCIWKLLRLDLEHIVFSLCWLNEFMIIKDLIDENIIFSIEDAAPLKLYS